MQVQRMFRPLLREAKESIVDSLKKGAPPGATVFFLRRGTVVVEGTIRNPHGDGAMALFRLDTSAQLIAC